MFGHYVQSLRIEKNIGSRELSKMLGKSSAYISQLEQGRNKNPDYDAAKLTLSYLGLSEQDVLLTLQKYNIIDQKVKPHINRVKDRLQIKEQFEEKCRQDAIEILNVINSLPDRTKEILLELLK
jgi:transcriptional regulator with XRE-family HTH domain